MRKIILISGKSGHGKDTLAFEMEKYFKNNHYNVAIAHYSSYIKNIMREFYKWNGVKDEWARNKLQWIGTDRIRNELNCPDYHVNRLCEDIQIVQNDFDYILIPDLRFPNEIERMVDSFGDDTIVLIRVKREGYESMLSKKAQNHESETALDDYATWDYVSIANNMEGVEKNAKEICSEILQME